MTYESKLIKYKDKYLYIKNQIGGKDCDVKYAEDILNNTYIKDTRNFVPFEKSFNRKHPVCSYSMWDKSGTQLYIPSPPSEYDRYEGNDLYVRWIDYYYMEEKYDKYRDMYLTYEASDVHVIMWSFKHKKWYNVDLWPMDDLLLLDDLKTQMLIKMDEDRPYDQVSDRIRRKRR